MKTHQSYICTCAILCCVFHAIYSEREAPASYNWFGANESDWRNNNQQLDGNSYNQASSLKLHKKLTEFAGPKFLASKHMRLKLLEIIPGLIDQTQKQISPLNSVSFVRLDSDKLEKSLRVIGNRKTSVLSKKHHEKNIDRSEVENYQKALNPLTEKIDEIFENQSIDPTIVNEEPMEDPQSLQIRRTRNKRSAARLLHKLIRIPYTNLTEVPVKVKEYNSSDIKLNTSSFESPFHKTELSLVNVGNMTALSYEQIEDLAFADLNGTEVELNVSKADDEQLPNAEELIAGPRYRITNKYRSSLGKQEPKRKRIPVRIHHVPMLQKKCERFTASMCIKADDYPMEQIMGSIRRHKNAMSALLAEYHDKAAELEYQEQLEEFELNKRRREDGNVITPGGMCASIVRYARPQKARSASGEWKYIVNTGRHTQTLRMEKCSSPQESCSYLSHNYRSRCTQVYNYHRLLSWDKTRGLHVDIFKVPTCCSCQVDGYRETFPPGGSSKLKEFQDYTPVPNNNPYSSIDDGIDYEDEDVDTGPGYEFGGISRKHKYNDFKHSELLLGSTNIRTKVNPPRQTPTVGSYLSPPSGSYEHQLSKNTRPTYYTYQNNPLGAKSQKPFKNYIPNESRVDLEISGTEHSGKEVKTHPVNENPKVQQKRKRVYTGLSNMESPYQAAGPAIQTQPSSRYIPTTESSTAQSNTAGATARKEVNNGKRINYDYHPIIDFFESHQKSAKGHMPMRSTPINSVSKNTETIIPRDRRIGYGSVGPENNWHPVMLNS